MGFAGSGSEDVKKIMSYFTDQENRLRIKRRWLAGLALTKKERRVILSCKSESQESLPESFLRKDDLSYEEIKSFVEKGVNGAEVDEEQPRRKHLLPLKLPNDVRYISSLLDYMTNKCLYSVAQILTHGSVDFDKIRCKMINLIKDHLRKVIQSPNHDLILEKLSPLLKDPCSFHKSPMKFLDSSSQSYQAAVRNVLDGLDDLPTSALIAMQRKVRGTCGYVPQVKAPRHGWKRKELISSVRNNCLQMLSTTGEGDRSGELLNKAMGVAVLALKLNLRNQYVADLRKFSPEIQGLQMEIIKAIRLLDRSSKRVSYEELKKMKPFLDQGSTLSKRSLRSGIRNLLTEYLFECSDMDSIPRELIEALGVINQKSRCTSLKYFSTEDIEKEVERILSLGAHTKQIVWDLCDEHEFDCYFANSYMEDLEDSDDDEYNLDKYINNERLDHSRIAYCEEHDPSKGITESISANFTTKALNARDLPNSESSISRDKKITDKNPYLTIQEASDKTSLFAYRLLGHLMDEFAHIEGLSLDSDVLAYLRCGEANRKKDQVAKRKDFSEKDDYGTIVPLVQLLWPSFPRSGENKLKKMMSSS